MYKFLWNVKLWFTGLGIIIAFPFVLIYTILIKAPIDLAKKFESERE